MKIKVQRVTGGETAPITVSKLTSVKELNMMVKDKFEVEPERQILGITKNINGLGKHEMHLPDL